MKTEKLQKDKLAIIQWISELQDYSVIEDIKSIMNISKNTSLTLEQKEAIDQGYQSIEDIGTKSHNVVIEETKSKYPHLFKIVAYDNCKLIKNCSR